MGGQFGLHPPFSSELSTLLTDPRGYIPHATGPAEAAEKLQEDQDRPDLRVPSEGAVRAAGAEAEAGGGLVAADGTAGPLGRLYDLPEPRVHHRGGETSFVANILQVRWWIAWGKVGRQSGADWWGAILPSGPTTSPDLSLQAPRQKPLLSAQLVFDSRGQLSHEPCIENMIQILTVGLRSTKASALKVLWLGQGAGWRNFLQGIPCSYYLESEALNLV